MSDLKQSDPKGKIGSTKWRQYCVFPARVAWEVGLAHLTGCLKYGRLNWRVTGVQSSVYVDAAKGHIDQWWEGEDLDPESQAHHLAHAIAGLNILLDCILRNGWTDDRPPKTTDMDLIREDTQARVDRLFKMFPNPVTPVTELTLDLDLEEWNGGRVKEPPGRAQWIMDREAGAVAARARHKAPEDEEVPTEAMQEAAKFRVEWLRGEKDFKGGFPGP